MSDVEMVIVGQTVFSLWCCILDKISIHLTDQTDDHTTSLFRGENLLHNGQRSSGNMAEFLLLVDILTPPCHNHSNLSQ